MPIHQHNKFCYLDFQLILPGYATRSESRTYKTQHQPSPVTCHLKLNPVFSLSVLGRGWPVLPDLEAVAHVQVDFPIIVHKLEKQIH